MNRRPQPFNPPTGPRNAVPAVPPPRKKLRCDPSLGRQEAQPEYGQLYPGLPRSASPPVRHKLPRALSRPSPRPDSKDSQLTAMDLPFVVPNGTVHQNQNFPLGWVTIPIDGRKDSPAWHGKADTYRPELQSPLALQSPSERYWSLPREIRYHLLDIEEILNDIEPTVWKDPALYDKLGNVNSLVGALGKECEATIRQLRKDVLRLNGTQSNLDLLERQRANLHAIISDLEAKSSAKGERIMELHTELDLAGEARERLEQLVAEHEKIFEHHRVTRLESKADARRLEGQLNQARSTIRQLQQGKLDSKLHPQIHSCEYDISSKLQAIESIVNEAEQRKPSPQHPLKAIRGQFNALIRISRMLVGCHCPEAITPKRDSNFCEVATQTVASKHDELSQSDRRTDDAPSDERGKWVEELNQLKSTRDKLLTDFASVSGELKGAKADSERWKDQQTLSEAEILRLRELLSTLRSGLDKKSTEAENFKSENIELYDLVELQKKKDFKRVRG
ncbi:hypothetical protein QBC35DRAFT_543761 [Podospora australis]|uniref:Uncharacterized protein n=1 Tax=Podospora australis TaxID=1536484 RepID=A0AAN6WL77_9PEZI|nr:hypothetical protein QBC35DRAFT_543761 [Podospora australis]